MNYELDHQDIRDGVRQLCAEFPGEYWRRCDREQAYPTEFVQALTDAGYLAALIPEEFGGSGLTISAVLQFWRPSTTPGATPRRATRRCTRWAPCCATDRTRKNNSICPALPTAVCVCRHSVSPSRAAALTPRRCAPRRNLTVITTLSTGKKSGPRAPNIPT